MKICDFSVIVRTVWSLLVDHPKFVRERCLCMGVGLFSLYDLFSFLVIASSIVGVRSSADTTGNDYGFFYQPHRVC